VGFFVVTSPLIPVIYNQVELLLSTGCRSLIHKGVLLSIELASEANETILTYFSSAEALKPSRPRNFQNFNIKKEAIFSGNMTLLKAKSLSGLSPKW
jgi:hypothetical protein